MGIQGIDNFRLRRLCTTIEKSLATAKPPTIRLDYGNELEQEIDILASCTVKTAEALKVSRRWVALKALEGELGEISNYVAQKLNNNKSEQ